MALNFRFEIESDDEPALGLPYAKDFTNGRSNNGFRDLRGNPDAARDVPEVSASPAFQQLLGSLAQRGSKYFSIGCDLGASPPTKSDQQYQAGGYIQLAFSNLGRLAIDYDRQRTFDHELRSHLQEAVGNDDWAVKVIVSVAGAAAIGGPDQIWSPVIHFAAMGPSLLEACASTERLISAIQSFVEA